MYIVYGQAELLLPYCSNLKEKRKTIQGIISRVRKRFNISISEVEYHDLWQRSLIGFTAVASQVSEVELITNAIKDTFYNYAADVEILGIRHELIKQDFGL
ncbi:MAG: DUF503 domain-containing protein [Syntrophomonadaceae bacterium]|nr:DUF503 domain-containing protein [Syntrophomonadaceae bacterium]